MLLRYWEHFYLAVEQKKKHYLPCIFSRDLKLSLCHISSAHFVSISAIRSCGLSRQSLLCSTKRVGCIHHTHETTTRASLTQTNLSVKPIPLYHYHRLLILLSSLPFSSYAVAGTITFPCSRSRNFILLSLYLNASANAGVRVCVCAR